MLNHQPLNKLVATYQRAVYAEEQRAAWLAWGALVEHKIANNLTDTMDDISNNVIRINIVANV